ncbi:MAG: DNA helicase, partial [Chloroflexota bacterium]
DPLEALSYMPSKGYGSLPFSAPTHNPNLVRLYIDAQQDYLGDRLYMLGALVVGCENGEPAPERRRAIVHLADGPPDAQREADLILGWTSALLRAIVEVAAPDQEGAPRAPIHLIFFNRLEQRVLLDGLGRHLETILGATPLYDFVTQLAAFDSPIVSFLDEEIGEHKNYPMVCQSLQAVAAYLKFDWNSPQPYRTVFRARLFDFWRNLDDPHAVEPGWYTGRARFNSMIPLEYAYAAWGELAVPTAGRDDFASYRAATADLLRGFQSRRLEAIEHITQTFTGNKQTEKRSFDLPSLDQFGDHAHTLAHALDEFVLIERHVSLAAWKTARLAPPERRVLSGDALLAAYSEADQAPGIAIQNRLNLEKYRKQEEARLAGITLDKTQKKALTWSQEGVRISLRFAGDLECGLDEVLGLTTLKPGDSVVVCKRWDVDSRLPAAEQTPFTPTPKQMLYGTRAILKEITAERDVAGRAIAARVELEMRPGHGGSWSRGFVFGSMDKPFEEGVLYSIDPDPNDWYGYWCAKVTEDLCAGGQNTLYRRLVQLAVHPPAVVGAPGTPLVIGAQPEGDHKGRPYEALPGNVRPGVPAGQGHTPVAWPSTAAAGQARFLAGLEAFQRAGVLPPFEPGKQEYIGGHGETPVLLVQGPPGTGKSYTTAFAVLARLQGAMTAEQDCRVFLTCKTHHATD